MLSRFVNINTVFLKNSTDEQANNAMTIQSDDTVGYWNFKQILCISFKTQCRSNQIYWPKRFSDWQKL